MRSFTALIKAQNRSMTRHAFTQVREAQRLRQLTYAQLMDKGDFEILNWIDLTIRDAEEATWDMLAWIEPARVEQETRGEGRMRFGKRMLWALRNNSQRGDEKRSHLLLCLGSLSPVISHLHQITPLESQEITRDNDRVRSYLPTRVDEHGQAVLGRHFIDSMNLSSTISLVLPSEIGSLRSAEEIPKNGPEETVSINHEISEMLAWRRSKQSDIVDRPQTKFVAELESVTLSD
ncbi:hypothetical protein TSTA_125110 [Talaromyces stipitatus ATCC 10500]|uniref:Uncharacterized protein n=1 Tax=Talaromyces stipitatus (strain ATCC 10500 / CBS 375.48 / QM 6759 / NRRL 1006) TaxID=441959 RepID=B8MCH7_TALSN|nr:uncharacterized protein TSTA_125110 [Talaromyces stipitatus ATCC 10500]EED18793.1 hypothetical protein TSTA_125110 [Talaromyces stipitatus ATCC 10500]